MNPLFWPLQENVVSDEDKASLISFIQSTQRFTQFTKVREFEEAYSHWQGCKYSVFVNSGSSANLILINVMKQVYGWKDGDEVIVPAITWVTNISPIIQCGLKPVFADINLEDFSFYYESIYDKINNKTKAIFVTHLIGIPAQVDKIREIIGDRDIEILEDCCESHGAMLKGIKIGNHSIAGTFSFYWGHHMTTVEGGMLCTNSKELYHLFLLKRSHGLSRELPRELHEMHKEKHPEIDPEFLFLTDGFNFRNTEFNAVLGLSQIKKLDQYIHIRNRNHLRFLEICKKYPDDLILIHKEGISSFCLPFLFKNKYKKREFQSILKENGIQTRPIVSGNLLKQPFLKDYRTENLKNADYVHEHAFYIGNNQFVGEERLKKLETIMERFFDKKMGKDSKIYVAGHTGLVGSAITHRLRSEGYTNLILRNSSQLDLRDQEATEEFFIKERPEFVFLAAAKVGGIKQNMTYPAEFIFDNIQIQNNVIHFSWKYGVKKLLFLASGCAYPTECAQPIKEDSLLEGKPEPTNQPFAIAKIAGVEMCKSYNKQYGTNFISVVPSNIFGPGDDFDLENSHLISALIRKFHEAREQKRKNVVLWGTGKPRRDLLYVEDVAKACLFLMQNYTENEPINIGTGQDISVKEIAEISKDIIGFEGEIIFDTTRPDGMMRRQLDTEKINSLGWEAETDLRDGLKRTYGWFLQRMGGKDTNSLSLEVFPQKTA